MGLFSRLFGGGSNEPDEPENTLVVDQCPNCSGTMQEDSSIRWSCDNLHPEVLAQLKKRQEEEDEQQ